MRWRLRLLAPELRGPTGCTCGCHGPHVACRELVRVLPVLLLAPVGVMSSGIMGGGGASAELRGAGCRGAGVKRAGRHLVELRRAAAAGRLHGLLRPQLWLPLWRRGQQHVHVICLLLPLLLRLQRRLEESRGGGGGGGLARIPSCCLCRW